jgi:hypothetical protein
MSDVVARHTKRCQLFIWAVNLTTLAALVTGQIHDARSAIFEQTNNGQMIEVAGGVFGSTPPGVNPDFRRSVSPEASADGGKVAGNRRHPARAAPSAGAARRNAKAPRALRTVMTTRRTLPAPRNLSKNLSARQLQMRALAAHVARRYARHRGVRKVRMSEDAFVRLFTTMIHRESGFNPRAVSPVGARGLGQLMPRTARQLGVRNSFSARENLEGAATYLTGMLDKFGSVELALAAYNAGPHAVTKYGGIPPYRETRQYVSDISHGTRHAPRSAYAYSGFGERKSLRTLASGRGAFEPLADAVRSQRSAPAAVRSFDTVLRTDKRSVGWQSGRTRATASATSPNKYLFDALRELFSGRPASGQPVSAARTVAQVQAMPQAKRLRAQKQAKQLAAKRMAKARQASAYPKAKATARGRANASAKAAARELNKARAAARELTNAKSKATSHGRAKDGAARGGKKGNGSARGGKKAR